LSKTENKPEIQKSENKPDLPKTENKLQTKIFEEKTPPKSSLASDFLSNAKKVITFFEPKKTEKKDKELDSNESPLMLFGQSKSSEKKDNPLASKPNEFKEKPVKNLT